MGQHHANRNANKNKLKGAVAVGALTAGALAAAGFGSAPTAEATCASFFGIGNSAECTSNLTSIAIAIGTAATAHADGYFSTAFAVGDLAIATTSASDVFNFATAVGYLASAHTNGVVGIATQLGPYGQATTAGALSTALNVTTSGTTAQQGAVVSAGVGSNGGVGNVAVNLSGNGTSTSALLVDASGNFNTAVNIGGTNNLVQAGFPHDGTGTLTWAFNLFGSDNIVRAGPGPLAIAVSILQNNATVSKSGPGFNINGFAVGTVAIDNAEPAGDSAAALDTTVTDGSAVTVGAGKPATPVLDVADELADKAPVASTAIKKTVELNVVRKAERGKVFSATSEAIKGVVDSATDGDRDTEVVDAVKDGHTSVLSAIKPIRNAMKDRREAITAAINDRLGPVDHKDHKDDDNEPDS